MKAATLGLAFVGGISLVVASCGGSSGGGSSASAASANAFGGVYGLTGDNRLLSFEFGAGDAPRTNRAITGLPAGERILAIDFRPSTGELYGLGSSSRLYRIDFKTADADPLGPSPFPVSLTGVDFGFDFDPVADRVRIVSDTDENLRVDPNTGVAGPADTALAYAATDVNAGADPNVVAAAYTGSFVGSTATTLYGIDSVLDVLVRQGSAGGAPVSPNAGTLETVGALGVDATGALGFDISEFGTAVACITPVGASESQLYGIDLATGAASILGRIEAAAGVLDVALRPLVQPRVFGVTRENDLVTFRPGAPGEILSVKRIVGLETDERVVGLDFRPSTGELYALGSANRLYRVSTTSAAAFEVGSTAFSPVLLGGEFGFDFNPAVDRLRVVSDAEQNLRLHPDTGEVASNDASLAYDLTDPNVGANPAITAAAYTENFSGASNTTLFAIDAALDALVTIGSPTGSPSSPNSGLLFTVGPLGADAGSGAGLDASAQGGLFASLTRAGATQSDFYAIDRSSGAARMLGRVGGNRVLVDIALEPPGVPRVYAITANGRLISFAPGSLDDIASNVAITGLGGDEILGADFRPATGQLYAVGKSSRLYRISLASGAATRIADTPFAPALTGTAIGVDFNPTVDRLRIVSNAGQNLRVHPDTGVVAGSDTDLAFTITDPNFGAAPAIVGIAYDVNVVSGGATTLWGVDTVLDVLVRQGSVGGSPTSPNSGELTTIGPLGVDLTQIAGFDIAGTNAAFLIGVPAAGITSQLYAVNLSTGATTPLGPIDTTSPIVAIAVRPWQP